MNDYLRDAPDRDAPILDFKPDGRILVEGVETTDPELIGIAVIEFREQNDGKHVQLIATGTSDLPAYCGMMCKGNNKR